MKIFENEDLKNSILEDKHSNKKAASLIIGNEA